MKIEKTIQNKVIFDYLNTNLKVIEIAQKYKLCRQSIRHIILENNLELKEYSTSPEIIVGIIEDYKNNLTNKEISQKYSLNRSVVQNILKRNCIILKPIKETSRKHQLVNENYFNSIDNEEKGYVLGLLYSDGYINHNGFGISLVETDKEILEKLSEIIYGKIVLHLKKSRPDSRNNKYMSKPQYRLEVVSNVMKNDLIKHGCVLAKTFKIRFPKLINIDVYRGFIRGYFDGDGCICVPTKRPQNVTITITSNTKFCDGLAEYVRNAVGVNMKSCIRYNDVGITRLTGKKQVEIFMNWLYKDSNIQMKRKFEKYKKYYNFL